MRTEYAEISILFYLIACALHDEKPDENILYGVNLDNLFTLSKRHSLSPVVYMAVQNTEAFHHANQTTTKQWKELKEKAIRKSIMLDAERQQILAELEKNHIWYMPLKGSVLKYLYPKEGMREMSDNDILFDAKYQKKVRSLFELRGYDVISYGKYNEDVYQKRPVYNFEMHTSLFPDLSYPQFALFDKAVQDRMVTDVDTVYGRHLNNEDSYIYLIAHTYKHHSASGTGLRSLVDLYLMHKNYGESLDWKYVMQYLHQMGIDAFEEKCLNLAKHLLDKPEPVDILSLPIDEKDLLMTLCLSGTYGTIENQIKNNFNIYCDEKEASGEEARIIYYFRRLFPNRNWCKMRYPFFYRYPVLLPFLWIYRVFKVLVFERKKVQYEINVVEQIFTHTSL